ncbi:hypothetical protein Q0Z83_054450 [Actinoplanes sichuanensis]|uniref:Leucine-rich repeat domain-containing protein n=1 Tax=Actinoplanes sichuanensis TaxID=512349 RepID=A0ABW4ARZ6_9ACTN|nr:hypothetical protein Q0Z83_054450 [Actinoplanes sichuanensis]
MPAEVNSISGWDWPFIATILDREWADLPEEVRAARRLSRGTDPVLVDLGSSPQTETTALGCFDLTSYPTARPMDWTVLTRLPRCTEISWSGPDRGLTAALQRHPQITTLTWLDAPESVDLSQTRVTGLRITGAALRTLRLQPRTRTLTIDGPAPATGGVSVRTVHAHDEGRGLHLDIVSATPATVAPDGLSQVRSVSVSGAGALSADTVGAFPAAHTVTLRWTAAPGRLDHPTALTALPRLRLLEMFDAYGLAADTLPDLPLDDLLIHGLRGSTARGLRTRFRRSPTTLHLLGAKSDTWLAANMDNPFRDWADDHTAAGAAVCKAYAKALKAITRASSVSSPNGASSSTASSPAADPSPATASSTASSPAADFSPAASSPAADSLPAAASALVTAVSDPPAARAAVTHPGGVADPATDLVKAALRELVERLDTIDDEFDILDTIRREEAGEAFLGLATRAGVPSAVAEEWFDTWRNF